MTVRWSVRLLVILEVPPLSPSEPLTALGGNVSSRLSVGESLLNSLPMNCRAMLAWWGSGLKGVGWHTQFESFPFLGSGGENPCKPHPSCRQIPPLVIFNWMKTLGICPSSDAEQEIISLEVSPITVGKHQEPIFKWIRRDLFLEGGILVSIHCYSQVTVLTVASENLLGLRVIMTSACYLVSWGLLLSEGQN